MKFVPKGLIDNKSSLVQVMACRHEKPFPAPIDGSVQECSISTANALH